VSDQGQDGEKN